MNKRRTVAALMCGAVLYVVANIAQVWMVGRSDQARSVDAIVVMGVAQYDGRPSPQLQARLDHVLALWGTGVTQLVITTGGNQPGDRFTEARASADYLIAGGIDETLIAMEDIGSTSLQSLRGVAEIMKSRNLESVLIVTDPYHALRSRLIAQDLGLVAYVSPTPSSTVRGNTELRRIINEGLGVSVAYVLGFERLDSLTN
ncbi:MAG: YdcF family protein [Actinobacteria bacterium]|nr:YdcF family protein [Actinomycetota bacterium]MDA2998839.1 YdcF family protein [Actinomycetota bacterium]